MGARRLSERAGVVVLSRFGRRAASLLPHRSRTVEITSPGLDASGVLATD
jgi:hypothetical protein